jgi:hypothetical protein
VISRGKRSKLIRAVGSQSFDNFFNLVFPRYLLRTAVASSTQATSAKTIVFGASNLLRRTAAASRDKSSLDRPPLPANPHPCYRPSRRKIFEETAQQNRHTLPGPEEEIHEALR